MSLKSLLTLCGALALLPTLAFATPGLPQAGKTSRKAETSTSAPASRGTVVYERTHPVTGKKYIGRSQAGRYNKRVNEHNRTLANSNSNANYQAKYQFKKLGTYQNGTGKIAEQSTINRYKSRGVKLENKRNEMTKENHIKAISARQSSSSSNYANRPSVSRSKPTMRYK